MGRDLLDLIARKVERLEPGKWIVVSWALDDLPEIQHNGAMFTPADRVLENIVGSAYEFSYWQDPENGSVVFHRRSEPVKGALRTYVSPDRRDFYDVQVDGLYVRKAVKPC